jgi:hydroxymethylpyrimidine pyrophosphatase-like HAD family hydrolase
LDFDGTYLHKEEGERVNKQYFNKETGTEVGTIDEREQGNYVHGHMRRTIQLLTDSSPDTEPRVKRPSEKKCDKLTPKDGKLERDRKTYASSERKINVNYQTFGRETHVHEMRLARITALMVRIMNMH